MTDREIKQIARKYAEETFVDRDNQDTLASITAKVIRFLLRDHCIVSREKVWALEDNIHGNIMYAHDDDDWQEAAHYILDVMPRRFIAVFGERPFDNSKQEEV